MRGKRYIVTSILATMCFLLCSCSYTPKIISLDVKNDIWIEVGKTMRLEKTVITEDMEKDFKPPLFHRVGDANIKFSYESSDDKVVTVSEDGTLSALAPGKSTVSISATGPDSDAANTATICCFKYMSDFKNVPDSIDIKLGESFDLTSLIGEFEKWNAVVVSEDDFTVSVDGTILKAEKPGKTHIILTLGADTKEITVSSLQAVTEYQLEKDALEGVVGSTETISIGSFLPETANDGMALTYISENEDVATVSDDGVVTFVSPGETVIKTQNIYGLEDKCTVKVVEGTLANLPGEGVPVTFTMDRATGELVYYDMYGKKIEKGQSTTGNSAPGNSQGSTNPDDYDSSDPAVKAVLRMVGGKYKCSEVAEAAAKARGKTGWKYTTYKGQDAKILNPEGFLKIGKSVSEPEPGDILYYADGGAGFSHVAVYIGNGMAVHGNWDLNGKTVIRSAYYTTLTKIIRP